jgi:hypothetical protein
MKQGRASRDVAEGGKREPRPYAINQNFPSQIGSAIDPMAVEKMQAGRGYKAETNGPTDGMEQGPGANRKVRPCGGQGCY